MLELSAGQIVADKYRIDGVMGTGGMGVVVAATHVDLGQRVAIKFLREVSPEALARFQREARLLVRLKSAHVARVIDVGSLDDDTPYIVMEHLEGSDLSTVLNERKRIPYEEAIEYVLQASEAVSEAHALGMVHRDLKPANLFLAKGPGNTTVVKVLDFGVSKILDARGEGEGERHLTNEGVALGSPGYMSPEQMTSARDVDPRSDIFSLGALLYRLISGQTPYKGNSVVTILAAMAMEKLAPLRTIVPDVPEPLAIAIERCLAQERDERFPTIAHFAHALLPFATRRGKLAIEQISITMGVPVPEDGLTQTVVRPLTMPTPMPVSGFAPHTPASVPPFVPPTPPILQQGSVPPPAASRMVPVALALVAIGVLVGVATWRFTRSRLGPEEDPRAAATDSALVPTPIAPPTSASAPPPVMAPPPATSTVEAPSTIEPSAKASATRPGPKPPRGTPISPRGGGNTAGDPSKPPNPADMPGGRH